MMSEAQQIKAAATAWLNAPSGLPFLENLADHLEEINHDGRWRPTHADLNELSIAIGGWLSVEAPSEALLERVSQLFDLVAQAYWARDAFGERYEVCSQLAFLAWRHATGLGRAIESQAWLRISDQLSHEPSVENDSLAETFLVPTNARQKETAALLSNPLDVYLGLSILRRDRIREPDALEIVIGLYEELIRPDSTGLPLSEKAFFLGELAWMAASLSRMMGKGKECAAWSELARSRFMDAESNEPLLAKVRLVEVAEAFDVHHENLDQDLTALGLTFKRFEMPREMLLCKIVSALDLKKHGDNEGAAKIFVEIVNRWRNSSELACFAVAASALAELRSVQNDSKEAAELAVEGLVAARESGDKCMEANAWTFIGTLNRETNTGACISALRTSRRLYDKARAQRMAAYTRVFLAEVLIENRRWPEALQELLAAVPVIQSENMIIEGVHGLKLLSMLPREFASEKAALRKSLALIRKLET